MKKEDKKSFNSDANKTDISIVKLINYNLLFFIPMLACVLLSLFLGKQLATWFEASAGVVARILMIGFMFFIFYFIIPFIRKREKISGIRYSIFAFCIVGLGITVPSALQGNVDLLLNLLNYVGTYILLTFIFCPEVLGMEANISNWFAHRKQMKIMFIYSSIVLLYVIGFGVTYNEIYSDNNDAFSLSIDREAGLGTFVYFSVITFTTIGYGEVTPVSTASRIVVGFEAMLGMIINVVFIAILLLFISNEQSIAQKREERKVEKAVEREGEEIHQVEKEVVKEEKEIAGVEGVVVEEGKDIKDIKKKVNKISKKINEPKK